MLGTAIDNVISVMRTEIALISFIEEGGAELVLAAHRGVSEAFVAAVSRVKLSQDFDGRLSEDGRLALVEDAFKDSDPARRRPEGGGDRVIGGCAHEVQGVGGRYALRGVPQPAEVP